MQNLNKHSARRFMTMLEVLIAMGLAMLMMTMMMYFYRQVDLLNSEMEKSQKEAFQLSFVENRLSNLIPKALSSHSASNDFYFFSSGDANGLLKEGAPSLIFSYHKGVSLVSLFSSNLLGRLYLDKNGNFTLATWPAPSRWPSLNTIPMKKEILLQDVESVAFKFYNPPDKETERNAVLKAAGKASKKGMEILPKDSWLSEWKHEYRQLPAILKITLKKKQNNGEMNFSFPLPNSDLFIIYDK